MDELNRRLSLLILAAEQSIPGAQRSNVGGWQSPGTVHTWASPAVETLLEIINDGVRMLMTQVGGIDKRKDESTGWSVAAWANVNRRGDFNNIHHHNDSGRAFWSGVYYVAAGDETNSAGGFLVFRNPSANGQIAKLTRAPESVRKYFSSELVIKPVSGLLLLFPSWLEHWVTPHCAEVPRISVAFNVAFLIASKGTAAEPA